MTQIIQAIFEHGVFRPLEPIVLAEQERVSLAVSSAADDFLPGPAHMTGPEAIARQKAALANLRREMDGLPKCAPQDGLGGADHDQILYGRQK